MTKKASTRSCVIIANAEWPQSRIALQCPHHRGDRRRIVRAMAGAHDAPGRMGLSPDAVKGIAYMEAIVRPQSWDHWDKMNLRPVLQALRSEAGEAMVLRDNFFVERILPEAVLRTLSVETREITAFLQCVESVHDYGTTSVFVDAFA